LDAGTYTLILSCTDEKETKQVSITFEVKEAAVPFTAESFTQDCEFQSSDTIDMANHTT